MPLGMVNSLFIFKDVVGIISRRFSSNPHSFVIHCDTINFVANTQVNLPVQGENIVSIANNPWPILY